MLRVHRSFAIGDFLDHFGKRIAQEDGDNRRRSLVRAQTMIVAAARNAHAKQILVVVNRFDDRGEEHDELQVICRGLARIEQILGFGANGPVVVLARTVDAFERLLMKQAHQTMARSEQLHFFHHDEVVVNRLIDFGIHRREFVLARSDLVVLGFGGNSERPQLIVEVFHEGGNRGANSTEIMLLKLLALARRIAEQRATGNHEIFAASIVFFLNKEVLLLVAHGRNDLFRGFAEQRQHALGFAVERGNRAQKRRFLIERFAGI